MKSKSCNHNCIQQRIVCLSYVIDLPYVCKPIPLSDISKEIPAIYAIMHDDRYIYIGQTQDVKNRLNDHIHASLKDTITEPLYQYMNAHYKLGGLFDFVILHAGKIQTSLEDPKLRLAKEKYWIKRLKKSGFEMFNVIHNQ